MPLPTNKYPARCERCNGRIPAGEGALARREDGNGWGVWHYPGGCNWRAARFEHLAARVPPGRYALLGPDDALRFYVVTMGRRPDIRLVSVQAGPEVHPIRQSGRALAILRQIAQDPREAALRYGREVGQCSRCGRALTDAESRARGIGPVCAQRAGW